MMKSMVTICPAAVRDSLLALGQGVGVDGGMSVELSPTGEAPPTHYGSHAWASDEFAALMLQQGLPEPLPEGVTAEQISGILGVCTVSVDPEVDGAVLTKNAHFKHIAGGLGLQVITPEEAS